MRQNHPTATRAVQNFETETIHENSFKRSVCRDVEGSLRRVETVSRHGLGSEADKPIGCAQWRENGDLDDFHSGRAGKEALSVVGQFEQ